MENFLRVFESSWCRVRQEQKISAKVFAPPFSTIFDRTGHARVMEVWNFYGRIEMLWPKSSENMTKKYLNFEKLHQKQFFQQGGAKTFACHCNCQRSPFELRVFENLCSFLFGSTLFQNSALKTATFLRKRWFFVLQ